MKHIFPPVITRQITFFTIVLVATAVLVTFFLVFIFNSTNTADASFLPEAAWSIYHGFTSGVGFRHFFGGASEQVIALGMMTCGVLASLGRRFSHDTVEGAAMAADTLSLDYPTYLRPQGTDRGPFLSDDQH